MTAKRSALIVATSDYKDSRLAHLDGPARDAEALRKVLAQKDIGGFDVRVALNSRVDTLRRTLEAFFTDRGRDDLLLVHFSGHGLKDDDGQLYLAAADTQIDRLLSTGVDAAWVNRLITRCRSEKIALFLDCCFAGAFSTSMGRRVGVDTAGVNEHFTGTGRFVITASDAMQYAFEGGQQVGQPPEPSPFTKALVDGLLTGEADRNEDGEVSIDELYDYLEDRIRETSPSQTPTKSAFNQVGDWMIAHSTRVPTIRLLPEELQKLLKSDEPLERFGALIELRDLLDGPDKRVSQAATNAIERLAQDDSRRVAAAAQRMLDEELARPRAGTRGPRRRMTLDPVPPAPDAPEEVLTLVDEPPIPSEVAPIETTAPDVAPSPPEVAPTIADVAPIPPEVASVGVAAAAAQEAMLTVPAGPEPPAPAPAPVFVPPPEPAAAAFAPPEPAPVVPPGPVYVPPPAQAPVVPPPPAQSFWVAPQARGPAAPPPPIPAAAAAFQPGVAPSPVSPAIGTSAEARTEQSSDVRWSLGRAAGRATLGGFLWVMFQFGWYVFSYPDQASLDVATPAFAEMGWLVAIASGIVVTIIEYAVPALRLPGGSVYRSLGGNRWVAAIALGIVVGSTIGLGIEAWYVQSRFGVGVGLGLDIPICGLLGFLIAEAVFGRSSHREVRPRAA